MEGKEHRMIQNYYFWLEFHFHSNQISLKDKLKLNINLTFINTGTCGKICTFFFSFSVV